MKQYLIVSFVIILGSSYAFAHGDMYSKKDAAPPTTAEQKEFGIAGDLNKVTRTIAFSMSDRMRFEPSAIKVKQGETIKLVVKNDGKLMHEMVIGTMADLKAHADHMRQFPAMKHEEAHTVHVPPGKTETLVWHFNRAGEFHYACLIAGHFEAGMIGKVTVVKSP